MPVITLVPLDRIDATAVETLLDSAFGPDRFRRTAYTIRGQSDPIPALSFAAIEDDLLVGSIQCWPIALIGEDTVIPLVMLGPVAVEPAHQGDGIGRRLMARALDAAATEGLDGALMLIGDPDYYGRVFDFTADRTAACSRAATPCRRRPACSDPVSRSSHPSARPSKPRLYLSRPPA
jgi:predicted N-acetyltransferase YhbS